MKCYYCKLPIDMDSPGWFFDEFDTSFISDIAKRYHIECKEIFTNKKSYNVGWDVDQTRLIAREIMKRELLNG